jgi:hypothetical protein
VSITIQWNRPTASGMGSSVRRRARAALALVCPVVAQPDRPAGRLSP